MGATITTRKDRIQIEQHSAVGLLWLGAWLFTIGFLKLTFWQGVAALVIWPYYLGVHVAGWLTTGAPSV